MRNLLVISFLCTIVQLHAQKSSWGIESGVSLSNSRLVMSYAYNTSNRYINQTTVTFFNRSSIKPTIGLFYQRLFSNSFAARTGLQYMEVEDLFHKVEFKYWTLPFSICYLANPGFNVSFGGYLSFLSNPDDAPRYVKLSYEFSKNDYGLGFSCEKTVYKKISLCARYLIGLKNLWLKDHSTFSNANASGTSDEKITNRILQFSVLYKLGKGR